MASQSGVLVHMINDTRLSFVGISSARGIRVGCDTGALGEGARCCRCVPIDEAEEYATFQRVGDHPVQLLVVSSMRALDVAVELGRAWWDRVRD